MIVLPHLPQAIVQARIACGAASNASGVAQQTGLLRPSDGYVYARGRQLSGQFPGDTGISSEWALKAMQAYGVCSDTTWDTSDPAALPTPAADAEAALYRIESFSQLTLSNPFAVYPWKAAIQGCINSGQPVTIGFAGHYVTIFGYDDAAGGFLIRDSYGVDALRLVPYTDTMFADGFRDVWTMKGTMAATVATPITLDCVSPGTTAHPSSSVSGNVITLIPRRQMNEGYPPDPDYADAAVILSGMLGKTLQAKVYLNGGWHYYFTWRPSEYGFLSYNGFDWFECDTPVDLSVDGWATCTHSQPFTKDVVWFARHRREGVPQFQKWLAALDAEFPGKLFPLAGRTTFTAATYAAQTDELGRAIAPQPLLGWRMGTPGKPCIILTGGTHACGEAWSRTVYRRSIRWLAGPSVEAAALLANYLIVCLAPLNAQGIEGGHYRGQFDYAGPSVPVGALGNDFNRHFNDPVPAFPAVRVARDVLDANVATGQLAALIDYHTTAGWSDPGPASWYDSGQPLLAKYKTAMQARIPYSFPYTGSGVPPSSVCEWAMLTKGCPLSVLLECNQAWNNPRVTDAFADQLGIGGMLALYDTLTVANPIPNEYDALIASMQTLKTELEALV